MDDMIVRCSRLYDGSAHPPRTNVALRIADGTIVCIEDADKIEPQADETVVAVDALVPGMINAHVHLEMSGEAKTTSVYVLMTPAQLTLQCVENARKTLAAGVTTVRDLGGTAGNAIDLRDAINAGKQVGPTIVPAGKAICMTGGHGHWIGRESDGPWDARKAVREQRARGAECIKLIATGGVLTKGAVPGLDQLTEEEMTAAVTEARRHEMRVAAHAIGTNGIKNALRAGVSSIEHGHLLDDEAIQLFKDNGAYLVPTLAAITCILEAGAESDQPDWVLKKAQQIAETMRENLVRAFKAGVRIAGGSDAGTPYNYHEDYAYEVELMTTILGMTPVQAIHAATRVSAELLGVASGRIEIGAPADLVGFARDPGADIRALRDPEIVIKHGDLVFDYRG
jgi:imidazolonepropionase-like amidohydrolase